MNNVYSRLKAAKAIITRSVLVALLIMGTTVALQAQVSVTATGGVPGPTAYPTLKAAFDAINAGTHQVSISIAITGNTTETATAVLNSSIAPANYNSILIKPTGAARVIAGNVAGALIKLNGADNVTIDGSLTAGTRDLTIRNTATTGSPQIIWVASVSASNGATGNTVMNCIIEGTAPANRIHAAIMQSSGTTPGNAAEGPNSTNLYANNQIRFAQYAVAMAGPSATNLDIENTITNNVITDIWFRAIWAGNQFGVLISQNTITGVTGVSGSGTQQSVGIQIANGINGGLIEKNTISNIKISGFWGADGILLNSTSANTDLNVQNNFIFDVANGGYDFANSIDDNGFGIAVNQGGGYKIHSNSVDLLTDNIDGDAANRAGAFWVGPSTTIANLDVRNNIFSNRQTLGTRFALITNSPTTVFSNIDYNDYYSTGSIADLDGTVVTTMAAMQAGTGDDANSVSVNPNFISATNLHLAPNSPLNGLGINLPGITQDIDFDTRNTPTDIGADEFTPPNCSQPANGGTVSASATELCGNGTATLTATGYSFGLGTTYQWEKSATLVGGYSAIPGQTNPLNGNTGVLTTGTWYFRLRARCNAGADAYSSNSVSITVNNPTAVGTGGTRCGVGTVNLSATGSNIRWYAAATGGAALGTGPNFTTPVISATTTFYAASSTGGITVTGGKPTHTNNDGGYTGTAGILFDAYQAMTIQTVRVFPQAAGTITVEVRDAANNTLPGCSQTFTFTSANTTTGELLTLNFPVPVGTDYRLVRTAGTIGLIRDFSPNNFPYSLGAAGEITDNVLGLPGTPNGDTYYFFYDWTVTTACEGVRVPVVATVTAPPGVGVSPAAGPGRTICSGQSITLTASSGYGYSYTWNPGNLTGNSITVSPTETTTYTLIADDGSCRRDEDITIVVNNTPSPVAITPVIASVCTNFPQAVVVTGGVIPDQTAFQEKFNSFPVSTFVVEGTGMTENQSTTYFQEGGSSVLLTYVNNMPATPNNSTDQNGYTMDNGIDLTQFANPVLTFHHIAALEGSATSNFDFGQVEYSLNGGSTWNTFPASDYQGSGAVYGGVIKFNQSSYPDWNAQFTSSASTPGAGPAASLWKEERIDLSAYVASNNFKVRFKIKSDVSVIYYGWLIDNIRISGIGQAPVTWSPFTNLYMDAAHTIPYAGQSTGTVYFWSSSNTTPEVYTATASGGGTCTRTITSTLSATSVASSVSIGTPEGVIFCSNDSANFTAVPVGAVNPSYQWYINGTTPAFAYGALSSANFTVNFPPGVLNNGDVIYVRMIADAVGGCPSINTVSAGVAVTIRDTARVVITGPATVCSNAPVLLTADTSGSAPVTISSYQWFRNGSPIGGNTSTLSVSQFGNYSVVITTNQGCISQSPVDTVGQNIWNVDVQPGPNGTISPAGPVLAVPCGDDVTFTVTPNPGYTIISVTVDGTPYPATSGPHTFTPANDAVIEAEFGISGCANPPTSFAGNNTAICASQLTYSLASQFPSIGGTAGSATWSTSGTGTFNGGGVFGVATTYTPSAADTTAGSVIITLTTNDPDGGGPCIASTSSFTLTLTPSPIVTITGTPGICSAGATATVLTANATFGAGTITGYQWYRGATLLAGATNATYSATTTGQYRVVVTGSNGCTGTDTLDVVLFSAPTVNITGVPYFCEGGFTDLSANATPGSGTILSNSFQWEYDDIPYGTYSVIPGANLLSYNVTSIGRYRVRVADSNGCLSAYSPVITVTYDLTPMSGAYTIGMGPASCTNFLSYARAMEALNSRGISGACTFETAPNYTEVVPPGGLKLGSSILNPTTVAAGRTITFTFSGSGPNPKLIADTVGTQTSATAAPDGIWTLRGVNQVTIEKVDFEEDTAINKTPAKMMEFAVGLFKLNNNDGAQNNTIQNCNIMLSRRNTLLGTAPLSNGATGILVANSTDSAATTPLVPTAASGANSGNKFYANVIREVNTGISLYGFNTASLSLADQNNDIGGTLPETGNQIINFGDSLLTPVGAPAGIFTQYQWNLNISQNTINNNDGTGGNTRLDLRGINNEAADNANTTISYNTIKLHNWAKSARSTFGIEAKSGGSGTNNTLSIINNNIEAVADSLGSAIGAVTGVYVNQGGGTGAYNLVVSNNNIHDLNLVTTSNNAGAYVYGVYNNSDNNSVTISGNTINNLSKSTGGGNLNISIVSGIYHPNVANYVSANIENNTISNLGFVGLQTGSLSGIFIAPQQNSTVTVSGNQVHDLTVSGLGAALTAEIQGLYMANTVAPNGVVELVQGNSIYNISVSGTSSGLHRIAGIYANNAATTGNPIRTITQNNVHHLFTEANQNGAVYGIWLGSGFNTEIRRNYIHSLFAGQTGATTTGAVRGILVQAAAQKGLVVNNIISLDLTHAVSPAAGNTLNGSNALAGIEVSASNVATYDWKVYYNTVRVAGTGVGNFGSSAFSTSTTQMPITLINNILVNESTPVGSGVAAAYRRGNNLLGYNANSNNNLFYTAQTATAPLLYYGTTPYADLPAMRAIPGFAARESASVSDAPIFVDVATNNLHIDPTSNCTINGGGIPVAGITNDFDGETRDGSTPDIGADEFLGTGGLAYVWKGVNTNWEDAANWCPKVPDAFSNVTIPNAAGNYPILTTTTNTAGSITIDAGGSITINPGAVLNVKGSTLTVEGTLTNNGTLAFNAGAGVAQSIPTGGGTISPMNILQVANVAGFTLNRDISILGELRPTSGNITLNDTITLESSATATAQVSALGGGVTISYGGVGKFVIENYIAAAGRAAWRFLGAPISNAQTINQAWQEGEPAGVYNISGYGTQIVGPSAAGPGFDMNGTYSNSSLKLYDHVTNTWQTAPGTLGPVNNPKGFMVFIRGDRQANTFGQTSNTVVRASGQIKTGNVVINGNGASTFSSVANPYPSALDFSAITRTGINNSYYVWDPKLGTFGGWQTFTPAGPDYIATPGGGSYGGGNDKIESGQAFMVWSTAAGSSLTIHETDKASGSNLVTRAPFNGKVLTTRLFSVGGEGNVNLTDGTRAEFDQSYSRDIDTEDARKASNFGESLAILVADKTLSVERRPEISVNDTIHYQLGQVRRTQYQFEIVGQNIAQPGLEAFLEDLHLGTRIAVSLEDTNRINFTVDQDAGSARSDRFRLVFKALAPVPVTFVSVVAEHIQKDVRVRFRVNNEVNIRNYTVERSVNGRVFAAVGNVEANNSSEYSFIDARPGTGTFFYRIRSNGFDANDVKYSMVATATIGGQPSMITVYPNPVKEDRQVKVNMVNQEKGVYTAILRNNTGQVIFQRKIAHAGGDALYSFDLSRVLAHGSYTLQFIDERKRKTIFKIVY